MTTPFDTVFRDVGKDLVGLFGVQQGGSDAAKGQYTSIAFGKVNKSTGTATNPTTIKTLDMSPPLSYKKEDVEPGLIEVGDCKIIIAAIDWDAAFPGVQPKTNDIILVNGHTFRVIEPNPITSGNLVAAYKMQVRDGHA